MKQSLLAAALGLGVAFFSASSNAAETYVIDKDGAHAFITFKVKHLGYSWLKGRFDDFEGTFVFDKDNPENSSVEVTINTASVNSNHDKRDAHLRSGDFLDVENHPQASFKSTAVKLVDEDTAVITGDFNFLGQSQPIDLTVDYIGGGDDPWGGHRQGFEGTASFTMADYGMVYNLGPASQEVFLELTVEGIRQ